MTFWYGSGSADPYHGITDPDPDSDPDSHPDSATFVSDLQVFLLIIFSRHIYIILQRKKVMKKSQKTVEIKVFLTT